LLKQLFPASSFTTWGPLGDLVLTAKNSSVEQSLILTENCNNSITFAAAAAAVILFFCSSGQFSRFLGG